MAVFLLDKRAYLKATPGPGYFLKAVRNTALRRLTYAGARLRVYLDPADLVIAEAMMHPSRRRMPEELVRLPEPADELPDGRRMVTP